MSQYAVKGTAATDAPVADLTDVDVSSLKPVVACCCFISSLFCKFPECLGCKSEAKILCWQQEVVCCKPITVKNADDVSVHERKLLLSEPFLQIIFIRGKLSSPDLYYFSFLIYAHINAINHALTIEIMSTYSDFNCLHQAKWMLYMFWTVLLPRFPWIMPSK